MKKIILTSFILFAVILSSTNASIAGGSCTVFGFPFFGSDTLFFNYGDTISISIKLSVMTIGGDDCDCGLGGGNVTRNGEFWLDLNCPAFSCDSFILNDTGTYEMSLLVICQAYAQDFYYGELVIQYRSPTPVNEVINKNAFQIYPSVSTGIFYIKAEGQYQLKKIQIFDALGRVIYVSEYNSSEINLNDFSNGVYLYAIEDNKETIFRGKIVKE